ncbi:MAG: hypothetical protein QXK07_06700 [Desulfurococcaceae archaeon]
MSREEAVFKKRGLRIKQFHGKVYASTVEVISRDTSQHEKTRTILLCK